MKRPKQLPVVDRNSTKKSATIPVGAGGNVRASFDWIFPPIVVDGFGGPFVNPWLKRLE
jgi:hypothetical protein